MAINYKLVTATSDASSPDTVFTATAVATHVKSIRIANESGGALTYHLAVYDHSASIEVPITVPATSLPDDDVDTMVEPFNLQNNDYIKLYSSGAGVKVAITLAENTDTAGATTSDDLAEGTTNLYLTSAERTKLSGIATGAEVNQNAFSNVAVAGQTTVAADAKTDTLTLVAGTGVTLTTDAAADSITIAASGTSSNSFETIAVAGQTSVVADSSTDTLTLAAGTGITITTDATTDTVTITNSVTAPNTFGTIAVATQSNVVADSTTDTLTFAAAGGMTITTDATTDTITLDSARLDDDDVTLSGVREIDLNGENLNIVNGAFEILLIESDGVRQANTVIADYAGTVGGKITLAEASANGGSSIAIQAPASLAASTTYTLPSADGTSGQVLATDSTGGLSWATRSSLAFGTIAVAGQSNVVADSASDTLTLAAGSGITITTDAGADSITIAASGGGGTPAGSTGQIQYNNAGAFGAEAALYYDATNNRLSVGGNTSPTGTITSRGAGTTTGTSLLLENSAGTERFKIFDNGQIRLTEHSSVTELTPTFSLTGTQNVYFRTSIMFRHTNVTTPFSGYDMIDTNTCASFGINDYTYGGLAFLGACNSTANALAVFLGANHGSTAPTAAVMRFSSRKTNGSTSRTTLADGEIAFDFQNNETTRIRILGSGAMGLRNTAPTSSTSLTVRGHGTGTGISLLVENSAGTARFTVRDDGAYAFAGGTVGAAQTGYTTFTNLTTDRTCDANATTVEELADILGTLIVDLKTKGIIAA